MTENWQPHWAIKLFYMRAKEPRSPHVHNHSFSPAGQTRPQGLASKGSILGRLQLKREIDNKFHKHVSHDEVNQSGVAGRRKSSTSLFISNPLTKSSYSLNDTITHKSTLRDITRPGRQAAKSMTGSCKTVNSSYRGVYNSSIDGRFFATRAEDVAMKEVTPRLKPCLSAREVKSKQASLEHNFKSNTEVRNNKFKLLFKEQTIKYKTASERKLTRIDTKINNLKEKRTYLISLMPRDRPKAVQSRPKPPTEMVKKEKILALTLNLIKYLELYYNMYQHNNIVAGHLKNIEGYNRIKNILMIDANRAKRITKVEDITRHFWVFREEADRPQFFGEEDLGLYNSLNGYSLKIERKYVQTMAKFNHFEAKKRNQEKEAFNKTYEKFQKKMGRHEPINKISKFIEQRVRQDQNSREQHLAGLENRGVTFNLIERSRELVLREKESAMKDAIRSALI